MLVLLLVYLVGKLVSSAEVMECAVYQISSVVHLPNLAITKRPAVIGAAVSTVTCHSRYCFALWQKGANGSNIILKKGCWMESLDCFTSECRDTGPSRHYRHFIDSQFCCCHGNLCNFNVSNDKRHIPGAAIHPESGDPESGGPETGGTTPFDSVLLHRLSKLGLRRWFLSFQRVVARLRSRTTNFTDRVKVVHILDHQYRQRTIIVSLVSICCLAILVIIVYLLFRICPCHRRDNCFHGYRVNHAILSAHPGLPVDEVSLQELLCRGRFSEVWRATLKGRDIAAKVYAPYYYKYFKNERDIYTLPLMTQDNLLQLCGSSDTILGKTQYILALTYYPHGSLTSYIRCNDLDLATLCSMCSGIAGGLAYLHSDIQSQGVRKPPIAHRDLNSRNILVCNDLSCVIADFGLSLTTFGSKVFTNGHAQNAEDSSITDVGTLRYMAPEVLDGAVNLRDCEASLKQIDVYSLGLVMWEVATRCRDLYLPTDDLGHAMGEYELPYAAMICSHPTFEEMQKIVCRQKLRPAFPSTWRHHNPVTTALRETIEESWDTDGEARLTALCVQKRVSEIANLSNVKNAHITHKDSDTYRGPCVSVYNQTLRTMSMAHPTPSSPSPATHIIPPNTDLRHCSICQNCDSERLPKERESGNGGFGVKSVMIGDSSSPPASHETRCLSHHLHNFMLHHDSLNASQNRASPRKDAKSHKSKFAFIQKTFNLGISGLTSLFRGHPKHMDENCYVGLESAPCSPVDNLGKESSGSGAFEQVDVTNESCDVGEQPDDLLVQYEDVSECSSSSSSLSEKLVSMKAAIPESCGVRTDIAYLDDIDSSRKHEQNKGFLDNVSTDSTMINQLNRRKFNQSCDSSSGILSSLSDDSNTLKRSQIDLLRKTYAEATAPVVARDQERLANSQCSLSNSSCVESVNSSDSQYSSAPRAVPTTTSFIDILKKRFSSEENVIRCKEAIATRLSLYNDRVMCTPATDARDTPSNCANSADI